MCRAMGNDIIGQLFPTKVHRGDMTQLPNTDGSVPELFDYVRAARCIQSVVHDVNNRLGAITGYVELLELEGHGSSETNRIFSDILTCAQKSSELLDSLADTIASRQTRVSRVDLCDLVRRIIEIHSFEVSRARIEIELECRGDCSPIPAVKGRLSRALMVILRDAIERVRAAQRGSIFIDVHGEEDAFSLVIRDTSGILPELGGDPAPEGVPDLNSLVSAREHVRFHGGELTLEPERGLLLRLPRANGLTEGEQDVSEGSKCADAGPRGC